MRYAYAGSSAMLAESTPSKHEPVRASNPAQHIHLAAESSTR
jgi:hypothetical protein